MSKRGWLIYSKKDAEANKTYIDWFKEEALLQNISLRLILREDLTIGIFNNDRAILLHGETVVDLADFAIIRTIEPLLNLHLEACGIQTFNSAAISHLCNHKSITHHEINKLNIPMVNTLFVKKENVTLSPPMDIPFVVKEATGRSGKQVFLIRSVADWEECTTSLSSSDLVLQASKVKWGHDVRVFVIGKEIIGAVLRRNENDFRANYKQGGTATWYPLSPNEKDIIHTIINSFDFDMVGIDFLIDKDDGLLFNEIEDVVGSRILSAVSDINILKKYIRHIKKKL